MIKTLRESKAKLSELVDAASRGEDVLITVRGKVKARLTRATSSNASSDRIHWVRELHKLQKATSRVTSRISVEEILSKLRRDARWLGVRTDA